MPIVGYPVRFAYRNTFEMANITATSQAPALPWRNVLNPLWTRVGRAGEATADLTVTFGLQVDQMESGAAMFALKNHNISPDATILLVGTDTEDLPTTLTSSMPQLPLINSPDIITGEFDEMQHKPYWHLRITGHVGSAIGIGYCSFGSYIEFDVPDFATAIQKIDPSVVVRAYGGARSTFQKNHYRVVEFALSPLRQEERRTFELMYDAIGSSDPIFLFLDPRSVRDNEDSAVGKDGLHRFTLFGYLGSSVNIDHLSRDWFEGPTITFEEARE